MFGKNKTEKPKITDGKILEINKIFDTNNINQPALINPGDRVNFYQITNEEYINWNE